jgi:hypothetical protein
LPYVESLEDNEAITASGLCTYSIIHDLKNKAVFEAAAAGQQTATTTTTDPAGHNSSNRVGSPCL